MINLGVNIDHVATVRNARGESHPIHILVQKTQLNMVQIQLQYI